MFKPKAAYEGRVRLVGSEMGIRSRSTTATWGRGMATRSTTATRATRSGTCPSYSSAAADDHLGLVPGGGGLFKKKYLRY